MSEQRKIEVEQEHRPLFIEFNRDIKVRLHFNEFQSTTLLLSRDEARDLMLQISNHLYWLDRDEQEAEENDT